MADNVICYSLLFVVYGGSLVKYKGPYENDFPTQSNNKALARRELLRREAAVVGDPTVQHHAGAILA